MGHKHTQNQIDEVINKWRGKHAVEKMIGGYDGPKWSRYHRFRMQGLADQQGFGHGEKIELHSV